jgi:hypothetical protein
MFIRTVRFYDIPDLKRLSLALECSLWDYRQAHEPIRSIITRLNDFSDLSELKTDRDLTEVSHALLKGFSSIASIISYSNTISFRFEECQSDDLLVLTALKQKVCFTHLLSTSLFEQLIVWKARECISSL